MQLKRSYFRHLKVEKKIYEIIFITRLANNQISLAVKTSRPQNFKVQKFDKDKINNTII